MIMGDSKLLTQNNYKYSCYWNIGFIEEVITVYTPCNMLL